MAGVSDRPKATRKKKIVSNAHKTLLFTKLLSVDAVFDNFLQSVSTPGDEATELKQLREIKVADQKWSKLIEIVNDRCNNGDLNAFIKLITAIEDTQRNDSMVIELQSLYRERKNLIELSRELEKEKSRIEDLKKKNKVFHKELKGKELEIKKMTQDMEYLKEQSKVTESELETRMNVTTRELHLTRKELLSTKDELNNSISEMEKKIENLKKEVEELKMIKQNLEAEVLEKSNVIASKEEQLERTENELQILIDESDKLSLEINDLKQKLSAKEETDEQNNSKVEHLENKIKEKEEEIKKLRKKQTMSRQDVENEIRAITNEFSGKIDQLNKDHDARMQEQRKEHREDINELKSFIKQLLDKENK